MSEHYNADPYTLSTKLRKRFREVKKVEQAKQKANDELKGRYALPASLSLVEDDEQARQEAKEEWARGKRELANKRRKLGLDAVPASLSSKSPSASSSRNTLTSLRTRILENTARQSNPFNQSRSVVAKIGNRV